MIVPFIGKLYGAAQDARMRSSEGTCARFTVFLSNIMAAIMAVQKDPWKTREMRMPRDDNAITLVSQPPRTTRDHISGGVVEVKAGDFAQRKDRIESATRGHIVPIIRTAIPHFPKACTEEDNFGLDAAVHSSIFCVSTTVPQSKAVTNGNGVLS